MKTSDFKTILDFDKEFTPGNVKAAMALADAKSSDLWKVPLDALRTAPGQNMRLQGPDRDAHVEWLAGQIITHGFYSDKPLAGYVGLEDGKPVIYIQDGGCRYDATLLAVERGAPITSLPTVIKKASTMEDLTVALLASNEGKPFSSLEKALGAKRLSSYGKSDAEISIILRCTPGYVGQLLLLAGAPSKIRTLVQEGTVSATMAVEAMVKHKDKAVEVLEGAVTTAKASGKAKASAKHSEGSLLLSRQKKHGPDLFGIIGSYLDTKPSIPDPFGQELDALFAKVGC
jgi:ParB family transcriptional regulator, chromosome partitioning protein